MPSMCESTPQPVGSTCKLACDDPYTLQGAGSATCSANGTWTFENGNAALGYCLLTCEALPQTRNAIISPQSCAEGYVDPGKLSFVFRPFFH